MITHLCLEYLGLGQLPIYDLARGNQDHDRVLTYLTLDEGCRSWSIIESARHRVLTSINIDTMVEALEPQLRLWLDMLNQEDDGTLYFPIRGLGELPDNAGTLLLAGCSYVPRLSTGDALDGADPVKLIVEGCQSLLSFAEGFRGYTLDEVRPFLDQYHPAIQRIYWQVLQRRFEREEQLRTSEQIAARSLALLREVLDEAQLQEMTEMAQFHVRGSDGHEYLIRKGFGHNVFRIEGGTPTVEYCLVSQGHLPHYDLMAMQKLLLETDAPYFLGLANAWDLTGEGRRPLMDHPRWPLVEMLGELGHYFHNE